MKYPWKASPPKARQNFLGVISLILRNSKAFDCQGTLLKHPNG